MHYSSNDFLSRWKAWGLPTFAAILAPWYEKISQMSLISDWFQPALNIGASVLGPLVCLVAFGSLHSLSRTRIQRVAISALSIFLILILGCFALHHIVGVIWFPNPSIQVAVWLLWAAMYLSLFGSLALAMVAALLSTPPAPRRQGPNNSRG
jgi:hypothetical protein